MKGDWKFSHNQYKYYNCQKEFFVESFSKNILHAPLKIIIINDQKRF
jgi:hypothetical protein